MRPTELAFSVSANDDVAAIRSRLAALRAEQTAIEARLVELDTARSNGQSSPLDEAPVAASSSPAEKIALFRSLFRGRENVFPKRWSNARSGRSGYAPACANEWVPRICDKPRIRCRECPNQAFIPVTAEIIARHLRGRGADGRDFTIGVYPMLADEPAGFWPSTSTARPGTATLPCSSRPVGPRGLRPRWNDRDPATAATCGYSSLIRFRRRRPDVLEHGCLPSRWNGTRTSGSNPTTDCFPARTRSRPVDSVISSRCPCSTGRGKRETAYSSTTISSHIATSGGTCLRSDACLRPRSAT